MNKDLTVGNPHQVLGRFCRPLFGSIIFQQIYNIADSLVAGKFIGENALAAVGNSYEITLIFLAFAFGCNMGCSVVVSRLFGAGDYGKMKTAVYTTCIFSGLLCLLLMLTGLLGSNLLLSLIRTPSEVFHDSRIYLDIYIWGLPFVFFYNIATGIFSALGDSKTPFFFLALSSLSNIGVDILFVRSCGLGVAGVAWATFLCQGISCILALITVFFRLKGIHCNTRSVLFDRKLLGQIISIAIPSTLQQSFISLGNIVIQGSINGFGSPVMAGYSGDHLLHHTGQRHHQLHRPESGCRQVSPYQTGFPSRYQVSLDAEPASLSALFLRRRFCPEIISGRTHPSCNAYRSNVLKDPLSLLLRGLRKACGGRCSERCRQDETLYAGHFHRFRASCSSGVLLFKVCTGCNRYLVCLAHRLDHCHGNVSVLLSQFHKLCK